MYVTPPVLMTLNGNLNIYRKLFYLFTFAASGGELFFIAIGTKNVLIFGNKTAGSDGSFAEGTYKTLVMPLFPFVFHFLHS